MTHKIDIDATVSEEQWRGFGMENAWQPPYAELTLWPLAAV